jgi:hypothetical protein
MIYLDENISLQRDKLHSILKLFQDAFPDNWAKTGIKECTKCEGTGIPVKKGELTPWQPGTYCERCWGLGYEGIVRVYSKYLCDCNGKGCKKCKDTGLVDWVTRTMGRK